MKKLSFFWEHLLKTVCVLDHLVFLHLLLLGPIGPLTKKHSDDLGDSDRTDDEGIFSPNAKLICMTREIKLTLSPTIFIFFDFLTFLVLFLKLMDIFFLLFTRKLSFWAGCVLSSSAWCLKFTCLPPFFDIKTVTYVDYLLGFAVSFSLLFYVASHQQIE